MLADPVPVAPVVPAAPVAPVSLDCSKIAYTEYTEPDQRTGFTLRLNLAGFNSASGVSITWLSLHVNRKRRPAGESSGQSEGAPEEDLGVLPLQVWQHISV